MKEIRLRLTVTAENDDLIEQAQARLREALAGLGNESLGAGGADRLHRGSNPG